MSENKLDIRVYPLDAPQGSTKAFASAAFDDTVAIRGIRVVESEKGLFVTMPQSRDRKTNEYHDTAFPVNGDLRREMNRAVLEEYDRISALAPDQRSYGKPDTEPANAKNAADVKIDIRVFPLNEPKGSTKAFANVTIDDTIAIRGVRVVESEKGLFAAMPQSQDRDGKYHDIAFPINGELRKAITKAVLDEYSGAEKTNCKSLADSLRQGAERAAENTAVSRDPSAKSRTEIMG